MLLRALTAFKPLGTGWELTRDWHVQVLAAEVSILEEALTFTPDFAST